MISVRRIEVGPERVLLTLPRRYMESAQLIVLNHSATDVVYLGASDVTPENGFYLYGMTFQIEIPYAR